MKTFATFYHNAIPGPWNGYAKDKLIPACGSDAVFRLDGRMSLTRQIVIARAACNQRGYLAFQIERGESYSRSKVIHPITKIS